MYRRFKCGRCHRDLSQNDCGAVFNGYKPIDIKDIETCPSCKTWFRATSPFKAKRTGES